MTSVTVSIRDRTVRMISTPALWSYWPFLPVVRRRGGREELGVMFDARGTCGRTGYSASVFKTNLFTLPATLAEFLNLPRETFDQAEELVDAGWQID